MNKEIYILEGGRENDWSEFTDLLKNKYSCTEITNLYEEPEKLKLLDEYKPWGIFIGTTGIGHTDERRELRNQFFKLEYRPETIIFASEMSAMTYLDIARGLKEEFGTKSYWIHPLDGTLIEYTWI